LGKPSGYKHPAPWPLTGIKLGAAARVSPAYSETLPRIALVSERCDLATRARCFEP
jgi:hypothetical protein